MRRLALFLAVSLAALAAAGQTVPELFQKGKEQVKAGAWQEALSTFATLDADAAKPGNEGFRKQLVGPLAFYRGVCEANLGQSDQARDNFEVFLREHPNASVDPSMYSKKAVAAFAEARKSVAAPEPPRSGSPSLFNDYQEYKPPANISEPPSEKWAEGPVQWLMTADDKRAWGQLTSNGERAEFVEKFWEARNPKPETGDNTFRTGFERRAAFADARFVQDEKRRGSLTDRGMVFVLLGPPTYGGRRPILTGEDTDEHAGMSFADPYTGRPGENAPESNMNYQEVWHYRRELLPKGVSYLQVDVVFITKKGYGANVLQRESQTLTTLDAAKKKPE
jgi:GWxTD domain-containing protein